MIDVDVALSPGWWIKKLSDQLYTRNKVELGKRESLIDRFERLRDYYDGKPSLPNSAENMQEVYKKIQRKARLNLAELCVEATRDRMIWTGFRFASGEDKEGDKRIQEITRVNDFDVLTSDVHREMLKLGVSYVIVGPKDEETDASVITIEDPRSCITNHDPANPRVVRAALKLMYDADMNQSFAYVYLRDADGGNSKVYVATHVAQRAQLAATRFNASTWQWSDEFNGADGLEFPFADVPVVRFLNKDGKGEFENHTDVIDRVNFMILQRIIIAMYQAFRQRAIKGELPTEDEDGEPIDYADVFSADPGAVWLLPDDVDLWEGGQADLSGNLQAVKDDVQHFAAVTRTPMYYMSSDAAQGSAEGASLQREGVVFKAEDRINRCSTGWETVARLAFLWDDDADRGKFGAIETIFAPAERHSLAERADAASKSGTDFPWAGKLEHIWQLPPEQIQRLEASRMTDVLMNPELQPATPVEPAEAKVTDDASRSETPNSNRP